MGNIVKNNEIDIRVPKIKKGVIKTNIGKQSVVYPNHEDEFDKPFLVTLNEIGTFIFLLIDEKRNVHSIVEELIENYDVTYTIAYKDIMHLFNDLEGKGIIVWKQ